MSPRRGRGLAAVALLAACCCCALPPALAQAQTGASLQALLSPDRMGASTTLTLNFRLSGGEEGIPPPLSRLVFSLPAGLGISARGVAICSRTRLQDKGPSGCPSASRLGHGRELLEVHAGSQTLPEQATIWLFRGPNRGNSPTLELLSRGETPLQETTLTTGVIETAKAPFGWRLSVPIPAIPTVVYEPNASIVSGSLIIGRPAGKPAGKAPTAGFRVPGRCSAGGFPFAASFTFADGSMASATATVACP